MKKQITETLIALTVASVTAFTGITAAHASIKVAAEPEIKIQEIAQRASFSQALDVSTQKTITADPNAQISFAREGLTSKQKPKPKPKPVEKPKEEAPAIVASTPSEKAQVPAQAPAQAVEASAPAAVPVAATGTKGDYQRYAAEEMSRRGMNGQNELTCLIPLWEKESNWNPAAANPTSTARGIPQMMMNIHYGANWQTSAAGVDYLTNPQTQINVGLDYIQGRYGTPCNALSIWNTQHWY